MLYVIRTGRTERGPYDLATALRTVARLNARGGTWTVRPARLDTRAALIRAEAARHVTPEAIAMRYMIPLSVVARTLARGARKGRPPKKAAPVYGPISVQLPADLEADVRGRDRHTPAEAIICDVRYARTGRPCENCQAYGGARGGGIRGLPREVQAAIKWSADPGAES